jgi:hypothetical protein
VELKRKGAKFLEKLNEKFWGRKRKVQEENVEQI